MKIFTHTRNIVFFQNGKFCWKVGEWKPKTLENVANDAGFNLVIMLIILLVLNLA